MLGKCFFSRDPERPFDTERPRNWARLEFDTERPRNWGSFGAELNGLKPWRRGGFRCFLGGWLVVENASKLSFFYRDPERPFDTERPRNWGSFGAEIQSVRLTPNVRGIGARLEQNSMG